jgi:hypothetical protein
LAVKLKVDPTVAVALEELVRVGPAIIVSTKVWVVVPAEFLAVRLMVYVPPLVALGVPEMVAVPLPRLLKATPPGRVPLWVTFVV